MRKKKKGKGCCYVVFTRSDASYFTFFLLCKAQDATERVEVLELEVAHARQDAEAKAFEITRLTADFEVCACVGCARVRGAPLL